MSTQDAWRNRGKSRVARKGRREGRNRRLRRHSLITSRCGNSQAGFHEFMNSPRVFPPRTRTSKLFHVTLHDRTPFLPRRRATCAPCLRLRSRATGNYALTVWHYRQDRRTVRALRSPGHRWRVTVCEHAHSNATVDDTVTGKATPGNRNCRNLARFLNKILLSKFKIHLRGSRPCLT